MPRRARIATALRWPCAWSADPSPQPPRALQAAPPPRISSGACGWVGTFDNELFGVSGMARWVMGWTGGKRTSTARSSWRARPAR